MPDLRFLPLRAEDVLAIDRRPAQRMAYGLPADYDHDDAAELAGQPCAWAAWRGDELLAVFGIYETFAGQVGICWSILAEGIGASHLELTRFIAEHAIGACALPRLEFYAKAHDIEHLLQRYSGLDPSEIVKVALARKTPECRWAMLLGMQPAHLLRRFGAADESYMMFERILPRVTAEAA